MIDLDRFERNQIDELHKEIQVMRLCRHPNLLPVYASFVVQNKLWIVTPYLKGGSCLDILKNFAQDGLEETLIASILLQSLQGLEYLHRNNLIHRDFKAGNLILNSDGHVYLADFGVSASLMDDGERKGVRKTFVGTPCWMAPEVMEMNKGYDFKADIWSLGITALELANGSAPFAKFPPMKVIYLTLSSNPPTLDRTKTKHKYSKQFKEMIDLCLQRDPSKRPSAEALARHPFFKQSKKKSFIADCLEKLSVVTNEQGFSGSSPVRIEKVAENSLTNTSWNFSDKESFGNFKDSNAEGAESGAGISESDDNSSLRLHNKTGAHKRHIAKGTKRPSSPTVRNSQLSNSLIKNDANSNDTSQQSTRPSRKSRFIVEGSMDADLTNPEPQEIYLNSTRNSVSLSTGSSPTSSHSTDSDCPGSGPGEIRKGRFFVSEPDNSTSNSATKENFPQNGFGSIDTLIQKQSSKVGRFILNTSEESIGNSLVAANLNSGGGFKFLLNCIKPNENNEYAVVSRKELESLVESNNQLKAQLDEILKEEEEKKRNPLLLLKQLESSLKLCLNITPSSNPIQ